MSARTSSLTQSAPGLPRPREQLPAEPGGPQGLVGGEAAGGVGQDRVPGRVEVIEQVPPLAVEKALAADGDGHDLATAGRQGSPASLRVSYISRCRPGADSGIGAGRCQGGASVGSGAGSTPASASDQGDDLQDVARLDRRVGVGGPGDEVAVPLDGHVLGLEAEVSEEVRHGQGLGDVAPFAVQRDRHEKFRRSVQVRSVQSLRRHQGRPAPHPSTAVHRRVRAADRSSRPASDPGGSDPLGGPEGTGSRSPKFDVVPIWLVVCRIGLDFETCSARSGSMSMAG